MTFVVVSSFIHLMIPALSNEEHFYFIKRKGPKAYFYYDGDLEGAAVVRSAKSIIRKKTSSILVMEAYSMYNGMTDLFEYLPKEKKDSNEYYLNPKKEISDAELDAFLVSNNLKH